MISLDRLIDWLGRHHLKILLPAAIATIASIIALVNPGLHEDYTIASLVGSRNPEFGRFQDFIAEFGGSEIALIAVSGAAATDPRMQSCQQMLVSRLKDVPAVDHVSALATVPALFRERVLQLPFVRGTLVSEDGDTSAVILQMRGEAESGDLRRQTVQSLRDIVAEARGLHPDLEFVLTGPYVTTFEMFEYVRQDLAVFSIMISVLMLVMLKLVLRQWSTAIFAIAVGAGSTLCTLGFTIAWAINMSLTTQTIVIMVSILTVATCVHIAAAHRETAIELPLINGSALVGAALRKVFWPCTAVILTSAAGFAAVTVSEIQPIRTFGTIMALGLLLSLVLAFAAAFTLRRRENDLLDTESAPHRRLPDLLSGVARAALGHRKAILLAFASAAVLLAIPIPGLEFESNFVVNFRKSSSVRKGYEFVERNLAPLNSVELVVRRTDGGSVVNLHCIQTCDQIAQQAVIEHNAIKKAVSLADILKLNLTFTQGQLPETDEQLQQKFAAVQALVRLVFGEKALANLVTRDRSALRVSLRSREGLDVWGKINMAHQIRDHARRRLGEQYDVQVTGLYYFYATLIGGLLHDQNVTFAITLFAIFAMTAIFFRSIKVASIAMIPNLFPMIVCLGLMGWFGISINMVTSMMLALALGIAVDDTIHYFWRFRSEILKDGDTAAAIDRTHRSVGQACVFTTVVIAGGFWVLCFSRFLPTAYFGALVGLTMLSALTADLVLLPVLITILKPFKVRPSQ